jgi:hypothetical protein
MVLVRGIFFDEADARAAALALARGGFEVSVARERLAGEDDDEDHPWAVTTDAPMIQLELLVETYDGWLDLDEEPPAAPPLPLPDQPRRLKRDDTAG